jgi:two-component system, NtrC family, response regulator AtoC
MPTAQNSTRPRLRVLLVADDGEIARATEENILVVEDDVAVAPVLRESLSQAGMGVECVASAAEALRALELRSFGVVMSEVRMPGASGMDLLKAVRRRWPETPIVLLTAHGTVRMAVEAMKEGAMDFLTMPFDIEEVLALVRRALAVAAPQNRKVTSIAVSSAALDSCSPAMLEAQAILLRAAESDCTVVLLGESGVGKEVAARFLHAKSPRASGPFVAVHCAALPENLLESELFGYERGAFTGAGSRKPGRLELAEGGTLFLDEIGETSPSTQVKLLRVLQERTFERLGGVSTIRANVRFVAATHCNLKEMLASGTFREDLFYRLSVCPVRLPALRERPEDIARLAEHFARIHGAMRRDVRFDDDALRWLATQPWPGNVRELQNFVQRMVLLSDAPTIGLAAVAEELRRAHGAAAPLVEFAGGPDSSLDSKRRETERQAVKKALERAGGNRTQAARLLGVSRRTLYNKLAEYAVD